MKMGTSMGNRIEDRLLKKPEVATMLSCSLRTIDRLVARGQLNKVFVLGAIRFRASQVQQIISGGQH